MSPPRWHVVSFAVYAVLLALLLVGIARLVSSRKSVEAATSNLAVCRQLADQITVLKATPMHASLETRGRQDLTLSIQRAAQLAKIADSSIARVDPQTSRRVGKSAYLQQPTMVEIRRVSLEQLVKFLRGLTASEHGLTATSLRLTAPRKPADSPGEENGCMSAFVDFGLGI